MTEKIALPTKECKGVDVPDLMGNPTGKVYRSRQAGYVEVDNPHHARLIRQSVGSMASLTIGMPTVELDRCECGELKFPRQTACGVCHMLRADLELLVA